MLLFVDASNQIHNNTVLLSEKNGSPMRHNPVSTFQRIHDKIGEIIHREFEEYKLRKIQEEKVPDEPPLIIF